MERIFLLTKEDIRLAVAEVLAVTGAKRYKLDGNEMRVNTNLSFDFLRRLAYVRKIDGSELRQGFGLRKPHMKPGFHPASLNPKLARAMVNLTGIRKGIILDCFCGVGGILVEAGLIGLKPVGYDIDERMITNTRINLEYYGIKDYKLEVKDALTLKKKFNYIVADLPYGKTTKKIDKNLYTDFLRVLKKILGRRAVIGFPDNVNYRAMIKKAKLKLVNEFSYYLHKSLSKRICVIE
jgi:tRNA (guanine10-N2)-dimethyltransferase